MEWEELDAALMVYPRKIAYYQHIMFCSKPTFKIMAIFPCKGPMQLEFCDHLSLILSHMETYVQSPIML